MGDVGVNGSWRVSIERLAIIGIHVLHVLQLFIERKAQPVFALVSNRQVGEDEIASRVGSVEIGHTRNRSTGEDWETRSGRWNASRGNGPCIFEGRKQEEVCVVTEGDLGLVWAFSFEDSQFDNRRWIDWATVG